MKTIHSEIKKKLWSIPIKKVEIKINPYSIISLVYQIEQDTWPTNVNVTKNFIYVFEFIKII